MINISFFCFVLKTIIGRDHTCVCQVQVGGIIERRRDNNSEAVHAAIRRAWRRVEGDGEADQGKVRVRVGVGERRELAWRAWLRHSGRVYFAQHAICHEESTSA